MKKELNLVLLAPLSNFMLFQHNVTVLILDVAPDCSVYFFTFRKSLQMLYLFTDISQFLSTFPSVQPPNLCLYLYLSFNMSTYQTTAPYIISITVFLMMRFLAKCIALSPLISQDSSIYGQFDAFAVNGSRLENAIKAKEPNALEISRNMRNVFQFFIDFPFIKSIMDTNEFFPAVRNS